MNPKAQIKTLASHVHDIKSSAHQRTTCYMGRVSCFVSDTSTCNSGSKKKLRDSKMGISYFNDILFISPYALESTSEERKGNPWMLALSLQ